MQGLFITATDTGVGKTEITAAIARQWRREGRNFAVCKPVATGAEPDAQGRLVADDTRRLAKAAGDAEWSAITPLVFPEPAAPPVAARLAGQTLQLEQIVQAVRQRQQPGRALLVEGAGGLLCPLTQEHTFADLIKQLDLPVLIVARRSLGTLNHTLLTVEAALRRDLRVVGIVVNETSPPISVAEQTNVEELAVRVPVPIRAVVSYRNGGYEEEIPPISAIDWWSLGQGRM